MKNRWNIRNNVYVKCYQYHSISELELKESVVGRLLNFVDIVIYTHSWQETVLMGISEPEKVIQVYF